MPRDRGIRWNLRVSELRDAYERYDGAAPQYRKNMWQKVSGYRRADQSVRHLPASSEQPMGPSDHSVIETILHVTCDLTLMVPVMCATGV